MWRYFFSIFLITGLFISCKNSNQTLNPVLDFPESIYCQWTDIGEDEIYPQISDMAVTDSSVVVFGLMDGKWLHEYSTESGNSIHHSLLEGQGPDDILQGLNLKIAGNRKSIYDLGNNAIKIFDADDKMVSVITMPGGRTTWEAWSLTDSMFITCGPFIYNNQMARGLYIEKIDSAAKESQTLFAYEDMPEALKEHPEVMCHQFTSVISPDRKHFAIATTLGGVLEIFDLESDKLIPILGEYLFKVRHDKDGWVIVGETEFGFSSLVADNDFLYGVYSGTNDANGFTKIGVWKWDGTPVKLIETDTNIIKMDLHTEENTLYAITQKEGDDLRLSKLKL